MTDIGATLREARMRRRIDITEVEQATKIRAKYLRAMEDEEWHLLPGPTFVKSFLRTYAEYLGLDARLLLEQWKRNNERVSEAELPPLGPRRSSSPGSGRSAPRPPGRWRGPALVGLVFVGMLAGLYLLGVTNSNDNPPPTPSTTATPATTKKKPVRRKPAATRVKLRVVPSAPVYVCLVDGSGRKLIPGLTLNPGQASRTFTARRFLLNLGNASAAVTVNGKKVPLPASSSGIGLAVSPKGRKALPQGRRPTCA